VCEVTRHDLRAEGAQSIRTLVLAVHERAHGKAAAAKVLDDGATEATDVAGDPSHEGG
jgi:hypothetical protein